MGTGNHIFGEGDLLSAIRAWVEPGYQHKDMRGTLTQKRQPSQMFSTSGKVLVLGDVRHGRLRG